MMLHKNFLSNIKLRLFWLVYLIQKAGRKISPISVRGLFLAIATSAIIISCNSAPLEPLRISVGVWPGYEPFYLARELGYYDDRPINLVETTFLQEENRAFLNGELDMFCTSLDATLELLETEANSRIFLILDVSNGADALLVQSEIDNIASLKGKKIGMQPSPLGRLLLIHALETVDLSIEDVELVNLEMVDQERPFQAKEIDAVVTYDPIRANLIASGAKVLFDSSQLSGKIVDVLVGRQSLISTHSQQIKILLEGWFNALDALAENPEESIKFMAKREGVSPEQFKQSLQGLRLISLKENQEIFNQTNTEFIEGMRRLSDFLKDSKVTKKAIDPVSILEGQILSKIKT